MQGEVNDAPAPAVSRAGVAGDAGKRSRALWDSLTGSGLRIAAFRFSCFFRGGFPLAANRTPLPALSTNSSKHLSSRQFPASVLLASFPGHLRAQGLFRNIGKRLERPKPPPGLPIGWLAGPPYPVARKMAAAPGQLSSLEGRAGGPRQPKKASSGQSAPAVCSPRALQGKGSEALGLGRSAAKVFRPANFKNPVDPSYCSALDLTPTLVSHWPGGAPHRRVNTRSDMKKCINTQHDNILLL